MSTLPKPPSGFAEFETLLTTVYSRLYERRSSDAALFRLMHAHGVAEFALASGCNPSDPVLIELLASHQKIQKEGFNQIDAEYCRDTLIVAMTLFDSFLTDLTRFLLLQQPRALPKDRQVRLVDVLDAGSYEAIVTGIVDRYVHELAYKKVKDRLQFLAEKFGFDFSKLASSIDELQSLANLRNELIHTISRFHYVAGVDAGAVTVEPRVARIVSADVAERSLVLAKEMIASFAQIIGLKIFDKIPDLV